MAHSERGAVPLSPLTMSILLALADEDQHGYALMKAVEAQTGGALKPGTGSLYAALQRLMDGRLITEVDRVPAAGEDPRRKHFSITDAGKDAVRAEAERMLHVLELAGDRSLAPRLSLRGERS